MTVTSETAKEIEDRVIGLIQDSIRKGKITRDEGFDMLQRIVREVENEIALASSKN